MSIPTSFIPAKRRVGRKRHHTDLAPPPVVPLAVSDVIDVFVDGESGTATVIFNVTPEEPLAPVGSADPIKWSLRFDNVMYACGGIVATDFDRIQLALSASGASAGLDQLSYSNAPSDISDTGGRQLPALVFDIGPAPLEIVELQNADFQGEQGSVDVVFNTTEDQPLNDVSEADPSKWTARVGGQRWGGTELTLISPTTIHVVLFSQFNELGPNVLQYLNSPSDISDALGRELAAMGIPL